MKFLKNLTLALCASLLLFTSACDKTEESSPVTLLTKISYENPDGTLDERIYEYNSQNKLAKLTFAYDTVNYEFQITYNSDGKENQQLILINGVEKAKSIFTWTETAVTEVYWSRNESNIWVELNPSCSICSIKVEILG